MKNLAHSLFGIILACGILVVLWYTYRNRFEVDIPTLTTQTGCLQALTDSETAIIADFEKRALEAIGGNGFGELPDPEKLETWKPSLQSLQLLFDTNTIVDLALSRLRISIAENQQSNPDSLLAQQKAKLSALFAKARTVCEALPK